MHRVVQCFPRLFDVNGNRLEFRTRQAVPFVAEERKGQEEVLRNPKGNEAKSICTRVKRLNKMPKVRTAFSYSIFFCQECAVLKRVLKPRGGGGSSIVKVPGDVPPARVYFFGLLV